MVLVLRRYEYLVGMFIITSISKLPTLELYWTSEHSDLAGWKSDASSNA